MIWGGWDSMCQWGRKSGHEVDFLFLFTIGLSLLWVFVVLNRDGHCLKFLYTDRGGVG